MAPGLVVVENSLEEVDVVDLLENPFSYMKTDYVFKGDKPNWPPSENRLEHFRERIITSFQLILTHVALKLNNCDYNLDKWRRILPIMKPKIFYKPDSYYQQKAEQLKKQQAAKRKRIQDDLIKIVGKFSKDLTNEKHRKGLINSDEETTNVQIDPSASDPLYKP